MALKKIFSRAEQEGFPITALREIKLLKQLRHPNVVELLDMAADKDSIYMVFPFMDRSKVDEFAACTALPGREEGLQE